ncbi:MAG: thioredoxin [Candidatus Fermentibacteraceae bacterium]|nr:thioredoxin [Candidatus Fermentibacteraceae bacterium]
MRLIPGSTIPQETKGTDKLTLVDFSADWCAPCKMLHPVLDKLTTELNDRVNFMTVDIDRDPATANQFGIRGVPTMIIFHGGKEVDRMVGFRDKASLKRDLEALAVGTLG